ncbi:hypothetical protein BGZ51_007908, partial [Haplosporangium sp. Z 767]
MVDKGDTDTEQQCRIDMSAVTETVSDNHGLNNVNQQDNDTQAGYQLSDTKPLNAGRDGTDQQRLTVAAGATNGGSNNIANKQESVGIVEPLTVASNTDSNIQSHKCFMDTSDATVPPPETTVRWYFVSDPKDDAPNIVDGKQNVPMFNCST